MAISGDPTARDAGAAGGSLLGERWAADTADSVDRAVAAVRDRTAVPLERLARLLVYGLLAAVLGVAVLVLVAVALVRVLDVVIPGGVWSAHLIAGGIFVVAGLFLWSKRRPPSPAPR